MGGQSWNRVSQDHKFGKDEHIKKFPSKLLQFQISHWRVPARQPSDRPVSVLPDQQKQCDP